MALDLNPRSGLFLDLAFHYHSSGSDSSQGWEGENRMRIRQVNSKSAPGCAVPSTPTGAIFVSCNSQGNGHPEEWRNLLRATLAMLPADAGLAPCSPKTLCCVLGPNKVLSHWIGQSGSSPTAGRSQFRH